ncbi:MAG: hypothetical protein ABIQ88_02255 [Chitinophagaceae bacterium]
MEISANGTAVILSPQEMAFIFYGLIALKKDIATLTASIVQHDDKRNASINAEWLHWLTISENTLRRKLFDEYDLNDPTFPNLLHFFNEKRGHDSNGQPSLVSF